MFNPDPNVVSFDTSGSKCHERGQRLAEDAVFFDWDWATDSRTETVRDAEATDPNEDEQAGKRVRKSRLYTLRKAREAIVRSREEGRRVEL